SQERCVSWKVVPCSCQEVCVLSSLCCGRPGTGGSQEPVWGSEPQECPLSEVSWEGSSQVWPVSWGRLSSSAVSRSQEGTWAVRSAEVECVRLGSGSGEGLSAGGSVPWTGTPRFLVWGAEVSSAVAGEGSRSQPRRGSCEGSLPEVSETEAVP